MVTNGHTTYAKDGWSIFETVSHIKYMVYGCVTIFLYVMNLLPVFLHVQVNVDMITDAVSYYNPDANKRETCPRWTYGPGYHYSHDAHHNAEAAAAAGFSSCAAARKAAKAEGFPNFKEARSDIFSEWIEYEKQAMRTIPVVQHAELIAKIARSDVSTGPEFIAKYDKWLSNNGYLKGERY